MYRSRHLNPLTVQLLKVLLRVSVSQMVTVTVKAMVTVTVTMTMFNVALTGLTTHDATMLASIMGTPKDTELGSVIVTNTMIGVLMIIALRIVMTVPLPT